MASCCNSNCGSPGRRIFDWWIFLAHLRLLTFCALKAFSGFANLIRQEFGMWVLTGVDSIVVSWRRQFSFVDGPQHHLQDRDVEEDRITPFYFNFKTKDTGVKKRRDNTTWSITIVPRSHPNLNHVSVNLTLTHHLYELHPNRTQPDISVNHTLTQPTIFANHILTQPTISVNHTITQPTTSVSHTQTQPTISTSHTLTQPPSLRATP